MYDELIKRLREFASIPEHCENVASCDGCSKEDICLSFTNKRIIEVATQAADAIEELSKPRWIPVTERLPKEMETVIVTDGKNVGYSFCVNDYGTLDFYSPWNITHWMPLPQPPEEET